MEKIINPPTIGKRPPSSIIYGFFIAAVLFLLLPLTQLIDTARNSGNSHTVSTFYEDVPEMDMDIEPPEEDVEEVEIEEIEEPPPPPDLSTLELVTDVDITSSFSTGSFDIASQAQQGIDDIIFELKDVSKRPVATYQREPIYPPELKRLKIQGTVLLQFVIDTNGRVRNAFVVRTDNDGFNKNALDAISKWKFTPAEKDGKKVKVKARQPLKFNLK